MSLHRTILEIHFLKEIVHHFKRLHDAHWPGKHNLCSKCNSALKALISDVDYTHPDCERSNMDVGLKKTCLQEVMQENKHACKYQSCGCDFNGSLVEVQKHENIHYISCVCNEAVFDNDNLLKHLIDKHFLKFIELTKPMAEIEVKRLGKSDMLPYNLRMGNTSLIVLFCTTKNSDKVNVIVYNATDVPREIDYMVKFVQNGVEFSSRGKVIHNFDISSNPETNVTIPGYKHTTFMVLTIRIYFDGYENVEPFDDYFQNLAKEFQCPVCFHTMSDISFQCSNGHNICASCKDKINVCPICRDNGYSQVKMKNLTVQLQRPCKYADKGCFQYNVESVMFEHEAICPMKPIVCELCENLSFTRCSLMEHFSNFHKMQSLDVFPAEIVPGLIMYDERVFEFNFTSERVDGGLFMKYTWYFRLVYALDLVTSYGYKLKFEWEGGNGFITKDTAQLDKTPKTMVFKADDMDIKFILTFV